MLEEVMRYINNRFESGKSVAGTFTVENGGIPVDGLLEGQYFWVEGSALNDGLHMYPATDMRDETFTGNVVFLAVPRGVEDIAMEVQDWCESNSEAMNSPYQSESFGGYSYTKAQGVTGSSGDGTVGWQTQFGARLRHWRKLSADWV